jgi:hypothetical protein
MTNCCTPNDRMWDAAEIVICGAAECNIGIIAASIPCLGPLLKRFRDHGDTPVTATASRQPSWRTHDRIVNETYVLRMYAETQSQGLLSPRHDELRMGRSISLDTISNPVKPRRLKQLARDLSLEDVRILYAEATRHVDRTSMHSQNDLGSSRRLVDGTGNSYGVGEGNV